MKHSQSRGSIAKSRRNLSTSPIKDNRAKNSYETDVYFCHFKNAMYMGGMKSFQKHGRGIAIHDDGSSIVTSYLNDFKHGHNIYYRENCILSIEYNKNKIKQCVIRIPNFLLLIRYCKQLKPDGKATLVIFQSRTIYYILFRKGAVVEKRQQSDQSILNKVFDLGNIQYLIGDMHASAVKFDIQKDRNIASQVVTNKFNVGFFKKGFMNGLGFVLMIKNPYRSNDESMVEDEFFISPMQRGYFYNSQLNGTGQKWFKNGNFYKGELRSGIFEGNGVLKNQNKHNWVFGTFEHGNLSELIDYSHQGDPKRLQKIVYLMHERKSNWINRQIQSQQHEQLFREIEKIIEVNPTEEIRNLKYRKQEVLRKIQDNFITEDVAILPKSASKKNVLLNQELNYNSQDKSIENQSLQSTYSKREKQKYLHSLAQLQDERKNKLKTNQSSGQKVNDKKGSPDIRKALVDRIKDFTIKQKSNSKNESEKTAKKSKQINERQQKQKAELDSKRLVNRNKIFKDIKQQQYEQLPKFNLTPKII